MSDYIKNFYEIVKIKKISSGQISLWFALFFLYDQNKYKPFTASNSEIELLTGLSRSGIQKNRQVLKEIGLIDFKCNGTRATTYQIISIDTSESGRTNVRYNFDVSESVQTNVCYKHDMSKSVQTSVPIMQNSSVDTSKSDRTNVRYDYNNILLNNNINIYSYIDSNRIIKEAIFIPPDIEEIQAYCEEIGKKIDVKRFVDFYEKKDWYVGNNWKMAVQRWKEPKKKFNFSQRDTDYDQLVANYYGYSYKK